ncbi:MAG: T9SS type A sorting domain-containing protein, partial [Bacteroidetes bacterium]|nr:T9SS type A sorting domain-containing protein [Bacteroidota bacterium]
MKKLILLSILILTNTITAQWQTDGIPVCDTSANKNFYMLPNIAADDSGGAYVCWHDGRNGNLDVYAQHVSRDGVMLWQRNGIPIAALEWGQQYPQIISDERGGAFIAWEDARGDNLYPYVQRIGKDGKELWTTNGIKASEQGGLFISIANDKRGGVILGWSSVENAFVQRLDSMGNRVWGDTGVQITNRPGTIDGGDVAVTYDGNGGAIVAWAEEDTTYIQHIDSSGLVLWYTNGIKLSNPDKKYSGGIGITSDLSGGVIVSWAEALSVEDTAKMYAQRISASGEFLWDPSRILVGAFGAGGNLKRNVADGSSGAFIGFGKKVQHLDSLGNKLWHPEGVRFTNNRVVFPNQTANGIKGIWSFWTDAHDLYAQYIDGNGNVKWGSNGVVIADIPGLGYTPKSITDGKGNAIVVWNAFVGEGTSTVYAAKVDTLGMVTSVEYYNFYYPYKIQMQQNYPNPFNSSTRIEFSIPLKNKVVIEVFDLLGRKIKTLINKEIEQGNHK